jgi:triosephosphate isomerase (TIM)
MIAPIFAANWKMNNGPTTAREFILSFCSQFQRQNDRTVVFFPPAVSLHAIAAALGDRRDILLGVQNVHWEDQGAFTGEISVPLARDAGARLVLVGHSERRHIFSENDEQCAMKCAAIERGGLTPMLCVGETLEERDAGIAEETVTRQLRAGLSRMTQLQHRPITIAYEPVWAIGTGRTATPEDAAAMHAVIREELEHLCGDRARATSILYGGSVNPGNAALLLAAPGVDGLLVGGASLDPGTWLAITRA